MTRHGLPVIHPATSHAAGHRSVHAQRPSHRDAAPKTWIGASIERHHAAHCPPAGDRKTTPGWSLSAGGATPES
jgi:hypothetical protein